MPNVPVFDPNSHQAKAISDLFLVTLAAAMGIVLLVSVLVIYVVVKYRQKPGEDKKADQPPPQVNDNLKLEIAWTVGPFVLLVALFIPALLVMGAADPPASAKEQQNPDLEIIGHQWWWEYRYPKLGIITANELYMPVGQSLLAKVQSADVIHDWWVPRLGRKMDALVSQPNYLWIKADGESLLRGECAEYCGNQHAWMQISVHAVAPAAFNQWVEQQKPAATIPQDGPAAQGWQVFLHNTCNNCHAIEGTPAQSRVGPDLTHLMSRESLGTGIIANTPENLKKWVQNVQAIKPGVNMPPYQQLNQQDLDNLVAFLQTLK